MYIYRSACEVPVLWWDFNETWIFSTHLRKIPGIELHENPPSASRVVRCGQTDRHDETNSLFVILRTLIKILRSAHTVYLYVLYGPPNKQRLFPYTALTDWFYNRDVVCVHCAVRTEFLNVAWINWGFPCLKLVFILCVWRRKGSYQVVEPIRSLREWASATVTEVFSYWSLFYQTIVICQFPPPLLQSACGQTTRWLWCVWQANRQQVTNDIGQIK